LRSSIWCEFRSFKISPPARPPTRLTKTCHYHNTITVTSHHIPYDQPKMSSSRGRLVQRSRLNADSTPARGRGRDSEALTRPQHELPPYEPPSCPLSESAKRKLDELRTSRDAAKYNKHLKAAIDTIPLAAAACNDRLSTRRALVEKRANKRKHDGIEDTDMSQDHKEAEIYVKQLEKNVVTLTEKSEKALRELIDLGDEARMQDIILREVEENIPAAPARPARRQRVDDEEEDENEAPTADAEILSAVELIKKAKADYKTAYQSKSMMQRYVGLSSFLEQY
jgi:hypothetical protein